MTTIDDDLARMFRRNRRVIAIHVAIRRVGRVAIALLALGALVAAAAAVLPPVDLCPEIPPCVQSWPPGPTDCDLRLCVVGGWTIELPRGIR